MKKLAEKIVLGVLFFGMIAAVCGIGLDRPIIGIVIELVCGFIAIDIALGEKLIKEVKEASDEINQLLDKNWSLSFVVGEASSVFTKEKILEETESKTGVLVTPYVPKLALPYYLGEPEGSKTEVIELSESEARSSKVAEVQKAVAVNDSSLDGKNTIESIYMDKDGIHLQGWCAGEPADIHCSWGGDPYIEYSEY